MSTNSGVVRKFVYKRPIFVYKCGYQRKRTKDSFSILNVEFPPPELEYTINIEPKGQST
jgi:hypothetical protein